MKPLADDCFVHDGTLISAEEALRRLLDAVSCVAEVERVPVGDCLGRVLTEDLTAPRNVPSFDNAAVDGYGFAHADLSDAGETALTIIGRSAAGRPLDGTVTTGQAVHILTGAIIPSGVDTVVMQEDVRLDGDTVHIPPGARKGSNCRPAGEDQKAGETILTAGVRLRPQDLGVAASSGVAGLPVRRRLSVALFSTGDELAQPGEDLPVGGAYDSNRPILRALLGAAHVDVVDLGVLEDRRDTVEAALARAATKHDVIITSGGASTGAEDHAVAVVGDLGNLNFWRLAIKPGRPLALGRIGDAVFVGLPGNPIAAAVCTMMYARPLLAVLGGETWTPPARFLVPAAFAMKKKAGRREFLRGISVRAPDGTVTAVKKYPRDGSGLLTSLRDADGLIEIDEECTGVSEGDPVAFIPFSAFGIV